MIFKYAISGITALAGLMMALWNEQDPQPTEATTVTVVGKTVEGTASPNPPTPLLEDVYVRLRQLKGERLTDRPKALTDDATRLYRDAIKALEANDIKKATALADAARELVRAIELAQGSRTSGENDPDLPPPPSLRRNKAVVIDGKSLFQVQLPPPLPAGDTKTFTFGLGATPAGSLTGKVVEGKKANSNSITISGNPVKIYREEGDETRNLIVESVNGQMLQLQNIQGKPNAKTGPTTSTKGDPRRQVIIELQKQIEAQTLVKGFSGKENAEKFAALSKSYTISKNAPEHGTTFIVAGPTKIDQDSAIKTLKHAYDLISEAKKANASPEAAGYLATARDLYNTARKEAEAGRFERASELANAAVAVANVPKMTYQIEFRATEDAVKGKPQVFRYNIEPREGSKEGSNPKVVVATGKTSGKEFRVEGHSAEAGTTKSEVNVNVEAGEDDPKLTGVGVSITFEEGKAIVVDLVNDGPSAKDGRIKKGDAILGIETNSGAILGFADKDLESLTKSLRGPAGSKVKMIVKSEGSSEFRVFEITRSEIQAPKVEEIRVEGIKIEDKPKGENKASGSTLPPSLD